MDIAINDSPILFKTTLKDDRNEVQISAINRALNSTDDCISEYCALEQSHNGRYINADLFKEIFPEYRESIESRGRYDLSVHNSCAWLAQELFNRRIKDPNVRGCIFVTGVPGAGKSFFIQSLFNDGEVPEDYIVFEGSLCNVEASKAKMQQLVDAGKEIELIVLNSDIKLAYENMKNRQQEVGRGATFNSMAMIASKLKGSIEALNDAFPIHGIGVYTKTVSNDNITLSTGIQAVREMLNYDFNSLISYLKELDLGTKGMVH